MTVTGDEILLTHTGVRMTTDHPLYDAARSKTRRMRPTQVGRWKLQRFNITDDDYARNVLIARLQHPDAARAALAVEREVPPGEYVSLKRLATPQERENYDVPEDHAEPVYIPVMSDTPAEINEQTEVLDNAHGHVLITGLGIGCVVAALLHKPEVKTITVVEVDPDVIAITMPYFRQEIADGRVNIVPEDALRFAEVARGDFTTHTPEPAWDYAWHDIWSAISSRNLDDDLAEHGISYRTMFDAYAPLIRGEQGAWAFREATHMDALEEASAAKHEQWEATFLAASPAEQFVMIRDQIVQRVFDLGSLSPDVSWDQLDDEQREMIVKLGGCADMAEFEAMLHRMVDDVPRAVAERDAKRQGPTPVGNPNEHLVR